MDKSLTINLVLSTLLFWLISRIYLMPRLPSLLAKTVVVPILLLHMSRHLGLMFLSTGATYPGLPQQFAYPAAFGDFIAAGLAAIALLLILERLPGQTSLLWIFNLWGTADLAVAIALATVYDAEPFMGAAYWIRRSGSLRCLSRIISPSSSLSDSRGTNPTPRSMRTTRGAADRGLSSRSHKSIKPQAGDAPMMLRRSFLMAAAAFAAASSTRAQESSSMTRPGYINVNGVRIFYEVHGDGKPLILLHGGVAATAGFGANIAALARSRRVIAVHLQGHGHTPDVNRPLRYEHLADDVAALVRELGLGKADFMGYSLGGGTALQAAIRHPAIVDRLVLVSTPMKLDGSYPEVIAAFEQMEANAPQIAPNVASSPLGQLYPAVNWENLFRKIGELTKRPFDWSSDVPGLEARTMLVFADADSIRPEHMIDFYRLLGGGQRDAGVDGALRPGAQLAVVPGATHYDIATNPLLPELALRFLAAA